MNKKKINLERVVSIISFLFLGIALYGGITLDGDPNSILPHSKIDICVFHAVCVTLSFFCIFKPIRVLKVIILLLESFITILTNYETLGIFFFYFAVILLLCNDFFTKRGILITSILFCFHIITIFLMYPHGWTRTIIAFATSIFSLSFFIWIYSILKTKLSYLIPTIISNNSSTSYKQPGQELSLSAYKLSERQINFVMDYLYSNLSYSDLSQKYNVSLSTVKKDFSEIFKIFNVSKIEELHILLLQYKVKK